MYTFPCAEDVHQTSHIPFAMIVQPLAEVGAGEESVPLVDFSSVGGPLRCRRCRAYINPFNVFVDGGRKFVCKFCDCENDVPDGYFSPLEANGKRHDLTSRPELTRGSVDFVASSDYIQKQLGPLRYVFVVDVSEYAVSSGMLQVLLDSLRTFLNGLCESGSASKVAIITFDSTVHFWNLRGSLQQPQMMVVPEVTNMFVPLGGGGLFFSYKESKAVVDYFLEKLAVMFTSGARSSPEAFSAAIQAASLALASGGGRILAFTAGTPDSETKRRDDIKLFGTDKERTLYAPRSPALKALAAECASRSTAIDMFVCPPPGTCDLVSLAALTNTTGGNLYYYPSFTSERDGGRLRAETARTLIRPFGYDAIAKVRCSKGITVSDYLGNLRVSNSQDVEFAGIDGDKAIVVALKHDDKLEEKSEPVLQFAMLYTTVGGERRIRVHNVSVNCSPTLPNLFRGADLDSILNVYAHIAIRAIPNNTLSEVRNMIAEKCVDVLAAYRKYCASSTSPGQLILPESLKLLPVFVLALSKSLMLRPGNDITADDRAFYMALFNSAGPAITTPLIYPRLYALHKIGDEYGIPDTEGRIVLPTPLRLTTDGLDADGAYLVENGVDMFLWLGRNTSPVLINELQSALIHNHPVGGFGERVLTMYTAIRQQRCKGAELRIVRSRDLLENKLFAMLVEDRSASGEQNSYVDFLCTVHKHIQNKLA
jgi:protein transport protein SEC24